MSIIEQANEFLERIQEQACLMILIISITPDLSTLRQAFQKMGGLQTGFAFGGGINLDKAMESLFRGAWRGFQEREESPQVF